MNAKILVVEDEAITAMDLENTLKMLGFEVVSTASSGQEAIKKTGELKPDLILMDIILKDKMDGIEATERIQTLFDIPIIYLTAYGDDETFERAKLTKPYGFLTKPINHNGLKAAIETALYKHKLDKQLIESEEQYHSLFKNNHAVMLLIDPKTGDIVDANPAATSFYGYSTDKLKKMNITDINILKQKQIFNEMQKAKSQKKKHFIFKHKLANGDIKDVEVYSGTITIKGKDLLYSIIHDITQQTEAEKKLRESNENYKLFFNNPLMGFALCKIITDNNGKPIDFEYLKINPTFETFTGLKKEDVINKKVTDILPYGEVAEIIQIYGKVALTGKQANFEYPIPSLGKYYEVAAYSPRKNHFIALFTDITERKKAEDKLKQARDHLEEIVEERTVEIEEAYESLKESELKAKEQADLLDITHDAIFVRDIDDKISFWNKGAEELYGWTKKEVEGKIAHELLKTESPELLKQIKLDVLIKGRWEGELVHKKIDGTKINVLSRWSLQRDKNNNPTGFLVLNSDITMRKKAEETAEDERQRLNEVMEILPAYLILLTPNYHVAFANRFFRERFGESHGKPCYEYLFGLTEPCENCETYKVLKTGKPHHWEWAGPDGGNYDIYDFPFKDADGSPLIMEFGIDITGRKKAEEQLKETIAELKRSNEELQSFAYITSHDLQEPLRTIASYAQLIDKRYKGQLDPDADDFIDFMVGGAKRMKNMIQGLLEYSRIGRQEEQFKTFRALDALNIALDNLYSAVDECHAEITYDSLPEIYGSESQITRVFQNLIGNALKFRKKELTPEIHISAKKEDNEFIFSVTDNGVGIEKQYTDRIFEVFKRLHTIDEYQGAGIGLAIVKRIINYHGGRVWVESEFGVGSTFYFTIPIMK